MWRRTLDGWGYSPLDQIDRNNVDELRMVWSRAMIPDQHDVHAATERVRSDAGDDRGRGHNIYALVWRGQIAPGTDQVGAVHAISAETGETAWTYEQRAATMSLVATGGGLVFGGDVNGRFRGPVSPGVSRWGREPQRVPGLSQIAAFLGPTWRAVARMLRHDVRVALMARELVDVGRLPLEGDDSRPRLSQVVGSSKVTS